MKKIELDELKKIQIDILNSIDDFCTKNNINYWIDCGTLLGAIRHKGYIPWDDDIDIGMLREDYEKFAKSFNSSNERYKFHCYELDNNWFYTYGKVTDEQTLLYEPDKKSGIESAIFVDVFVYDNAPENEKELQKMFRKRDIYRKLSNLQIYKNFYVKKKTKYNFIRYPLHLLMQLFPKRYFIKKGIEVSKKYSDITTIKVGNFTSSSKMTCDKKVFDSFIDVEFEGRKYKAPVGYDQWLRSFYGDYMKLPPEEKRVSHHRFEAYYK